MHRVAMAVPFGPVPRASSDRLRRTIRQQARRELALAHLFSAAVRLAPTLDDKQLLVRHCADELEHYELALSLYDELGGHSQLEDLAAEPTSMPRSWPESMVAAHLLDQACRAQLCAYVASPDDVLRAFGDRLLSGELDHLEASGAALRELANRGDQEALRSHVAVWLPRALASLDPPEPEADPSCGASHASAGTRRATVARFLSSAASLLAPLRSCPSGTTDLENTAAMVSEDGMSPRTERSPAPLPVASHAPAVEPIARVLHREGLRRLTDAWTLELGLAYQAAGRVSALERRGGCVLASVRDDQDYGVTLWVSGDALAYSCACAAGSAGVCCKHVVAAGIAWLAGEKGNPSTE
jgi:hypothetical protein